MSKAEAKIDHAQLILEFIDVYQQQNLRPPTIREMQRHCGFKSPRAVSYLLEKLEKARKIVRRAHSRGIQLAGVHGGGPVARICQLPLFNGIPAGMPDAFSGDEAPETLRFIPATLGISNPTRAFAVRVRGDSMLNAGILSGDTVILERKEAKPGDIVAALIDGESTLKRLVRKGDDYFLKAENPAYRDLEPVEQLSVQGVVVGVLRRLAEAA